MRSLSNSSKAQFFILSTIVIVALMYVMGKWIAPSTIPDTSGVATDPSAFIFNDIVEKANQTVKQSPSCQDAVYNLQEYQAFVQKFAQQKGYILTFSYPGSPCGGTVLTVDLLSPTVHLSGTYAVSWP